MKKMNFRRFKKENTRRKIEKGGADESKMKWDGKKRRRHRKTKRTG